MNSSGGMKPADVRGAAVFASAIAASCPDAATTVIIPAVDCSTGRNVVLMVRSDVAAVLVWRDWTPRRLFSADSTTALSAGVTTRIVLTDPAPDASVLITNASGGTATVTVGVVVRP